MPAKNILILVPKLPEPEPGTFSSARFDQLVEKLHKLIGKRRDKTSFAPSPGCGIPRNNTWINVSAHLNGEILRKEGFSSKMYALPAGEDFIEMRVQLHNTEIAAFKATRSSLTFWGDGWDSMTTARRLSEAKAWIRRMVGVQPPLDNRVSIGRPLTERQLNFAMPWTNSGIVGPNLLFRDKYVRIDIGKRRAFFNTISKGAYVDLLLGHTKQIEVEAARWCPSSSYAHADALLGGDFARRVSLDHSEIVNVIDLDSLDSLLALYLDSQDIIPCVPYKDTDFPQSSEYRNMKTPRRITFPRSLWDDPVKWKSLPDRLKSLLPEVERPRRTAWGKRTTGEYIVSRLTPNLIRKCERYNDDLCRVFIRTGDVQDVTISEMD